MWNQRAGAGRIQWRQAGFGTIALPACPIIYSASGPISCSPMSTRYSSGAHRISRRARNSFWHWVSLRVELSHLIFNLCLDSSLHLCSEGLSSPSSDPFKAGRGRGPAGAGCPKPSFTLGQGSVDPLG